MPGEVSLALNITGCPHSCEGCHSPHLREEEGEWLNEENLLTLLHQYGDEVTCVCFMGGDAEPQEVARCSRMVKACSQGRLKTAWYSGSDQWHAAAQEGCFDYVKIGSYRADLGALTDSRTNQRFYRLHEGQKEDLTHLFWKGR